MSMDKVRQWLLEPYAAHGQSKIIVLTNPEGEEHVFVLQHDAFYNPGEPRLYAVLPKEEPSYPLVAEYSLTAPGGAWQWGRRWADLPVTPRQALAIRIAKWLVLLVDEEANPPEGYKIEGLERRVWADRQQALRASREAERARIAEEWYRRHRA